MDNNANQSDNTQKALHDAFWASYSTNGANVDGGQFRHIIDRAAQPLHEPSKYINFIEAAKQADRDQSEDQNK